MKIYIDFDGTLFDTDKYTEDFMNIFNKYGIDKDLFDKCKKIVFDNDDLFNLDIIIDYFIKNYNIDSNLKKEMEDLLNNSYIYPDVINCLDFLSSSGYELYLLSYGDEKFQTKKIFKYDLVKYFNKIIITDKDKSKLDLDYENGIFIDNNPIVIESLYNINANNLIRIKRKSDRYTKFECNALGIIECEDFYEVIKFLKGGFDNE